MSMEIGFAKSDAAVAQGSGTRQGLEDVVGGGDVGARLRAVLLDMARYGTQHVLDEVDRAARAARQAGSESRRKAARPNRAAVVNTLCATAETPTVRAGVELFSAESGRATYTLELPAPYCPRVAPRVTGFRAALDAARQYARAYGFVNIVRDGRVVVTIGVA